MVVIPRSALFAFALTAAACGRPTPTPAPAPDPSRIPHAVVPVPASIQVSTADTFRIDSTTQVALAANGSADAQRVAAYLVYMIHGPLGAPAQTLAPGQAAPARGISLRLDASRTNLGLEGYELTVTRDSVSLTAAQPNGLFYGVQTIRQLLPISVEHRAALNRRLGRMTTTVGRPVAATA